MKYRKRIYYSDSQKARMWERWQQGKSLQQIAQLFDRNYSSIQRLLAEPGGNRPRQRHRSEGALSLAEREEILSSGYPIQVMVGLCDQFCGIASQPARNLEKDGQGRHVFAALNLAHVRTLDARQVGQCFLGDALSGSLGAHHGTEGLGQFGIESGRANRPAALDRSLLHEQKRRFTAQLKPR